MAAAARTTEFNLGDYDLNGIGYHGSRGGEIHFPDQDYHSEIDRRIGEYLETYQGWGPRADHPATLLWPIRDDTGWVENRVRFPRITIIQAPDGTTLPAGFEKNWGSDPDGDLIVAKRVSDGTLHVFFSTQIFRAFKLDKDDRMLHCYRSKERFDYQGHGFTLLEESNIWIDTADQEAVAMTQCERIEMGYKPDEFRV
jgi:hypothetical protein